MGEPPFPLILKRTERHLSARTSSNYSTRKASSNALPLVTIGRRKSCLPLTPPDHNFRGSHITARLADLYEDRFIAFAFLAVGYSPPRPVFDMEQLLALTKKLAGYELVGYWKFFSAPDAPEIIEKNVRRPLCFQCSLITLIFKH